MREVSVGFLWHMHQPYYKDPVAGTYLLPWVRLHSVRGYYDMIALLEEFPEVACAFNLVPSLLTQIEDYTTRGLRDTDFILSEKRPSDLTLEERVQILARFFTGNVQTLISPFSRYQRLLEKRGLPAGARGYDEAAKRFTDQEILDLQVLFNLTWIGFMGRKDKNLIDLVAKGRSFSESDKAYVLARHLDLMREIIPLYRKAHQEGRVELTTSPFYHPIGPLLMNVGYALRSLDTPLPDEPFSHPEDLEVQVSRAVEYHESVFGVRPGGLWPPEGSVCPEMLEILAARGIRWIASDEDILFASLRQARTGMALHRPYLVEHAGSELAMFFRDRPLSDSIGFVYSRNPPEQGAQNFMQHLRNIARGARAYDFEPFVSVILDGENPWEYYPDGGERFLRTLYGELSATPGIRTARFGDALERTPPSRSFTGLYTGSWINHNFAVWIGHEEDRKAWEMLARTRGYLESKGGHASDLAWEELYIAEGSDWFWWYGEDFSSANDEDFDNLFRLHLSNCYLLHHDQPPQELSRSIIGHHEVVPLRPPSGFVAPIIDGRVSHYYEWLKAGCHVPPVTSTSMYRRAPLVTRVFYGFDRESLFVRVDFTAVPADAAVCVHVVSPRERTIHVSRKKSTASVHAASGLVREQIAELPDMAWESILELKVPFSLLDTDPSQRVRFFVAVLQEELEIERHPSAGVLSFTVPDEKFERILWHV
jgi:alpha-amylase/alpha-mannosidase (GH57 family)